MAKLPMPTVQIMAVCAEVTTGPRGATSLIDLAAIMRFPEYPVTVPDFQIYIELTDLHGERDLEIRILDPDLKVISRIASPRRAPTPATDMFLHAGTSGLRVERPGPHFVSLCCDGEPLMERVLTFAFPTET